MAYKTRIIGHVDQHGEVHENGCFAFIPDKKRTYSNLYGDSWMITAQKAFTQLACDPDLNGGELKTFMYLMGKLDFENYILVTKKEVEEQTGYSRKTIIAAFNTLEKKGILIPGPKFGRTSTWRLDPNYGFKGNPKDKVCKDKQGNLTLVVNNGD